MFAAPQEPSEYSIASKAMADPASGKLIVVIDDDALALDAMRGLLRRWGCLVVTAESASAALASLAGDDQWPDLIISDYRLADGHTGIEAIRAAAKRIPRSHSGVSYHGRHRPGAPA